MKIPENIKKLILDNIFDSHIRISTLLDMINKEFSMTMEELYDFLYQYEKENKTKIIRAPSSISEKLKNEIYEQRLLGVSYAQISDTLRKSDIHISPAKVRDISELIFAEMNRDVPKADQKHRTGMNVLIRDSVIEKLKNTDMKENEIEDYFRNFGIDINTPSKYNVEGKYGIYRVLDDKMDSFIYEEKKAGNSYRGIVTVLKEKGIETSYETIRKNSKRIFLEKNEKEPRASFLDASYKNYIYDSSEIYDLRKQGKTYNDIMNIINQNSDEKISYKTIRTICRESFKYRNETEIKKVYSFDFEKNPINKDIYELRKNGYSYREIAKKLREKDYYLDKGGVAYRCKKIFESKKEDNPCNAKGGRKRKIEPIDNIIYNLKINRYSDGRIQEFFKAKNINITKTIIKNRISKVFYIKKEQVPTSLFRRADFLERKEVNNKQLVEVFLDVVKKKNASKEQINKFAKEVSKIYNTDINVDFEKEDRER